MSKDIATYTKTKEILDKYNLNAKKVFGQNFLIDNNIIRNIVDTAMMSKRSAVIEIGPGIGALTQYLSRTAGKVIAFEIDERLREVLEDTLSECDNVEIIWQDFLKADLNELVDNLLIEYDEVCVVANLPYYITTPILTKIIESRANVRRIVAMMQKEVAQRLSGKPNTKDYNSLSVFMEYYTNTKIAFTVPHTVFIPRPNVDSAVICIDIVKDKYILDNEAEFFEIVRGCFVQRRKTIYNNLKEYLKDSEKSHQVLVAANIEENRRAETLSIDEFIVLAKVIQQ